MTILIKQKIVHLFSEPRKNVKQKYLIPWMRNSM